MLQGNKLAVMAKGQSLIALIILLTGLMILSVILPVNGEDHPSCILNDDYCDCGDDELQSNACSLFTGGRLFHCTDSSLFKQTLFLSRVGDGICDCCNGSDEIHAKRILCPNVCDVIGAEISAETKINTEKRLKGEKLRGEILLATKEELYAVKLRIWEAQKLIFQYKKNIVGYKTQLTHEEKLEKTEFDKILQMSQDSFYQHLRNFDVNILRNLLAMITLLTLEDGVEAVLVECDGKYVLDGPDPDDSSAFALVYENICRIRDAQNIQYVDESKGEESMEAVVGIDGISSETSEISKTERKITVTKNVLPDIAVEKIQLMVDALALNRLTYDSLLDVCQHAISRANDVGYDLSEWLSSSSTSSLTSSPSDSPSSVYLGLLPTSPITINNIGYKRNEAEILRDKISHEHSMIITLKEAAKEKQKDDFDYGPDDSFYSLRDRCFSYQEKEYTYEICMFKEAKQGTTLIGRYEKYETVFSEQLDLDRPDGIITNHGNGNSQEFVDFIYNNGEICYGTGRPRSIKVRLECSSGEEKISEISEIEICSYTATLLTPLGCI